MRAIYTICMVAALCCVLVAGAHAITVNVSVYKHNFTSNETIPSVVTNMSEGVYYSQKATFYQYMKPGEPSEIGNNNVTWPFAHKDEVFNMTNVNTVNNSVYIGHWWPPERGGGYEELWFNGTSYNITAPDGTVLPWTWNRTYHYEYDQLGTYISRWHAHPAPGAEIVESTFWINGSKMYGPTNFTENTSVWSRNPAYVTLDYYENNTHAAHDWFTIDMDVLPFTPTQPTVGNQTVGTIVPDTTAQSTGPDGTGDTGTSYSTTTPVVTGTGGTGQTATPTVGADGTDGISTPEGTQGGTPAGTPSVTPTANQTGGAATGDEFPWLYLLLLLLLLLGIVGFVAYNRRKNGENK